jgi:hypothetical protein
MGVMKDVVNLCVAEGIRDKVKIMVGGAPVTMRSAIRSAPTLYTPDAASAADVALEFCKQANSIKEQNINPPHVPARLSADLFRMCKNQL